MCRVTVKVWTRMPAVRWECIKDFKGGLEKVGDDAVSSWKRNVRLAGEKMELDSVQI